ncbi:hypothetical protein EXS74_00730 [Candidatus Woesearchaeota archaeon]|nr:hypothetical protein [Candidatus Woesearchaeota archaeon]
MKKGMILILGILILSLGMVSAATTSSCTDSDGDDTHTDGSGSYTNDSFSTATSFTEACVTTSSRSMGYSYFTEYTCKDNGDGTYDLNTTAYYCNDCTNRTCGTVLAYAYTDTDGGNYSLVEGWTNYSFQIRDSSGSILVSLGTSYGSHDTCASTYLREYYVSSTTSSSYPSGAHTSTNKKCSLTWGSAYSCISLTGPDRCGISCTSASSCSGYACIGSAYCMTSCTSDSGCNGGEGYTCDTSSSTCVLTDAPLSESSTPEESSPVELCNNGIDDDSDSLVDYGGIDTDSDGDIEYSSGCVKRSVFVQYGSSSITCAARSSYKCQSLADSSFATCPSGTYIAQDTSDCASATRSSAPEQEEQGFFAKLWAWITGN